MFQIVTVLRPRQTAPAGCSVVFAPEKHVEQQMLLCLLAGCWCYSFYTNLTSYKLCIYIYVVTSFEISSFCNMSLQQRQIHIHTRGWTLTTNCRTGTLKREKWTLSGKQFCSGYWSFTCEVLHFHPSACTNARMHTRFSTRRTSLLDSPTRFASHM